MYQMSVPSTAGRATTHSCFTSGPSSRGLHPEIPKKRWASSDRLLHTHTHTQSAPSRSNWTNHGSVFHTHSSARTWISISLSLSLSPFPSLPLSTPVFLGSSSAHSLSAAEVTKLRMIPHAGTVETYVRCVLVPETVTDFSGNCRRRRRQPLTQAQNNSKTQRWRLLAVRQLPPCPHPYNGFNRR